MMLRLFVAVLVPPAVQQALVAVQRGLASAGVHLRWTRPENMHLTLSFLGRTALEREPAVKAAIRAATANAPPFDLEARGLGTFPSQGAIHVLWSGVGGDVGRLRDLQADLERRLRLDGFVLEERPVSPHLTLARASGRVEHHVEDALRTHISRAPASYGRWRVDAVHLIQSDLRPAGSQYTSRYESPLGERGGACVLPGTLRSAGRERTRND